MAQLDRSAPVRGTSSLTSLKLYNFFIYGAISIFAGFLQLYLQEIGMTKLEIGSLMAIGPFVSLFANPFWGFWSDKSRNIRIVLMMMMGGTFVLAQGVFYAPSYAWIYVAMIFFYFFQSPLFAQTNSLILGYIDGTGQKFGSFRLWGSLGWALTAVAAGPVIDRFGVSSVSIIFACMIAVAFIFSVLLPRQPIASDTPIVTFRRFGKVMFNPYFMIFIGLGVLVSVPNAMNSTFMSLYIVEMGGDKQMVGWAIFTSSILEVGVFLLLDRLLKRKMSILLGSLILVSLLFALRWQLMALANNPMEVVFIQLMHSVTFGGYFYVGTQLTMLFIPRPYRSSGQAVYTMAWGGLSGVIAGLFGGWLFQSFGAEVMYNIGVFFSLIGAAGFAIMWLWNRRNGYQPTVLTEMGNMDEDK
ncbi:MFS transporter, PPP family, 3-phenylpropionic acid transporter [Paenibacillus polysaccharolyticus]|uniref:MFS transporter, PPP family, 3-phenylpropionic acid transporter n=1 Tax=Paenibacillus polysaccharolyticus TaxID=582692 RepID=A0A1G5K3P3_9BACL|nr:MFS transporter, PPP family, 3-phenylpropionic acid transporter [Paenibacillus polysaccharolyticus]